MSSTDAALRPPLTPRPSPWLRAWTRACPLERSCTRCHRVAGASAAASYPDRTLLPRALPHPAPCHENKFQNRQQKDGAEIAARKNAWECLLAVKSEKYFPTTSDTLHRIKVWRMPSLSGRELCNQAAYQTMMIVFQTHSCTPNLLSATRTRFAGCSFVNQGFSDSGLRLWSKALSRCSA